MCVGDPCILHVQLEVRGYNDKLETLLKKILDRLTTFTIDPQRFAIIKEAVCSHHFFIEILGMPAAVKYRVQA